VGRQHSGQQGRLRRERDWRQVAHQDLLPRGAEVLDNNRDLVLDADRQTGRPFAPQPQPAKHPAGQERIQGQQQQQGQVIGQDQQTQQPGSEGGLLRAADEVIHGPGRQGNQAKAE
jgi:hypothetical protein